MTSNPKCSSLNELNSLCKEVSEKANQEFDTLIKQNNIDLNNNKAWASEYYSLVASNTKLAKKIKRLKVWRWILIIFLIFPFFLLTNAAKKKQAILDVELKKEADAKQKLDEQLKVFATKLSYDFMFKKIIEPLWKDIKLNIYQDAASFKSWIPLMPKLLPEDSCFLELVSGSLFDNPFMMYNYKIQSWYMHVYSGSLAVPYTTRDSEGHWVTRTEIVVATETLPAPKWDIGTELVYHFDKPAKLCFINNSSKRELKKLNKKNIQSPMENKEFEKLFPAKRSDEKDYRVVFTPLAQENFVKLFREQQYSVIKDEEVTTIQAIDKGAFLDTTDNEAVNYDVQTWRDRYSKWVSNFVYSIGLLTLPIASIPLYTQFKTDVSSPSTGKNIASYAQVDENITLLFNLFGLWSKFDTDVIFEPRETKTITINKVNFSLTTVECNYFWLDHKVVVKPTPSIHSGVVMVPVPVIYYRDRVKKYVMCQSINLNNNNYEGRFGNILVHKGQIMCLLEKASLNEKDINQIKNIIEKIKKA